jgi:hypothetical protein
MQLTELTGGWAGEGPLRGACRTAGVTRMGRRAVGLGGLGLGYWRPHDLVPAVRDQLAARLHQVRRCGAARIHTVTARVRTGLSDDGAPISPDSDSDSEP